MGVIHETIFRNYNKPNWESYLEDAPDYVIDETGLSREKLQKVLSILYKNRIIN